MEGTGLEANWREGCRTCKKQNAFCDPRRRHGYSLHRDESSKPSPKIQSRTLIRCSDSHAPLIR